MNTKIILFLSFIVVLCGCGGSAQQANSILDQLETDFYSGSSSIAAFRVVLDNHRNVPKRGTDRWINALDLSVAKPMAKRCQ